MPQRVDWIRCEPSAEMGPEFQDLVASVFIQPQIGKFALFLFTPD
jgi:hypothetical protein